MPPKQPKKGKGKKVTVTDPTSAPAPAPAAPPNPEVQPVVDAHIANVGSEHFPGGYFPIPYTLTSPDAESFPQLPPLRKPLEAALFGKWDQPGNPHLVWRIDATRVNFALTRGVLSRFCCAVMGRYIYPTTLAVELKLSQVTLEAFNKTLKLCTAAASKEFVNVLDLQEMPPQGLDPEEQWLWVDPVKKSGWTHRTATDAVVRYQTVKVQAWVRPPSTHNRLLLCSIDALGQLQRWKQCEWSDVRAIAPAPHLKEAAQAFMLRFQKQLVGKGPKGEKGGRAASDVSGDPSLHSKGRTEQQARGSRRPHPTTTPREAAQAAQAAGDGGGGTGEGGDSPPGGGEQAAARAAEGGGGRPQDGTGRAHR